MTIVTEKDLGLDPSSTDPADLLRVLLANRFVNARQERALAQLALNYVATIEALLNEAGPSDDLAALQAQTASMRVHFTQSLHAAEWELTFETRQH